MHESVLSANKANRLFWLGRYAERAYLLLHLLRKAYDVTLDNNDPSTYGDFLKKLDVYVEEGENNHDKMMAQLYDPNIITSVRSVIECANDNAIVLRTEIVSESFSYIEMCRSLIKRFGEMQESNITLLQSITDYLLSFWGSIDERVFGHARILLETGKLIEHLDMNIRFDYKYYRIEEAYETLKAHIMEDPQLFDHNMLQKLDVTLNEEDYNRFDINYKSQLLNYLNHLILV